LVAFALPLREYLNITRVFKYYTKLKMHIIYKSVFAIIIYAYAQIKLASVILERAKNMNEKFNISK